MKVHYMNILLFALPLNILEHNERDHNNTTLHTSITRSLCECELYEPANYDNDQEMKEVMQQFEVRTSQRFHEYDDRMKTTRQKCKEQCDQAIQKIILKDKMEKQMAQQLTTLETKINTDDIPTCICEKTMADKTEKFCLNCGVNVGGGVALSSGVLGGIGEAAISLLKPAAITAAEKAAVTEATDAATQAGIEAVRLEIEGLSKIFKPREGFVDLRPIVNKLTYNNGDALVATAKELFDEACTVPDTGGKTSFCNTTIYIKEGDLYVGKFGKIGSDAYDATLTTKTTVLTEAKVGAVEATYASYQTAIIASIVAIVVIILIMVIIYLILRYRRKKKMKKKLQYIKLLEE
ncbi:hypothetical protein PFHG_03517 [Plasmodium falciparum HB3]|uniref:Rifin n=1 Tax=Plasmodium falciparum (isolate HB3) TaxID=137071 RepID=A0A0L7KFB6_PLAFX|nr:hypothetical protein PFHG_03517 [Plasmodium falciparum HB3]